MSKPSTHHYETLYILKGSTSESDAGNIHQKIDSVIGKFKGKLLNRDDWGVREMAYEIRRERSGRYVIIQYTGNSGVVEEIERHFRISDDVIRNLTVVLDKGYDYSNVKKQLVAAEEESRKNREQREQRRPSGKR